jgi:hypothetical protein
LIIFSQGGVEFIHPLFHSSPIDFNLRFYDDEIEKLNQDQRNQLLTIWRGKISFLLHEGNSVDYIIDLICHNDKNS